jgi:hypothetical protein
MFTKTLDGKSMKQLTLFTGLTICVLLTAGSFIMSAVAAMWLIGVTLSGLIPPPPPHIHTAAVGWFEVSDVGGDFVFFASAFWSLYRLSLKLLRIFKEPRSNKHGLVTKVDSPAAVSSKFSPNGSKLKNVGLLLAILLCFVLGIMSLTPVMLTAELVYLMCLTDRFPPPLGHSGPDTWFDIMHHFANVAIFAGLSAYVWWNLWKQIRDYRAFLGVRRAPDSSAG